MVCRWTRSGICHLKGWSRQRPGHRRASIASAARALRASTRSPSPLKRMLTHMTGNSMLRIRQSRDQAHPKFGGAKALQELFRSAGITRQDTLAHSHTTPEFRVHNTFDRNHLKLLGERLSRARASDCSNEPCLCLTGTIQSGLLPNDTNKVHPYTSVHKSGFKKHSCCLLIRALAALRRSLLPIALARWRVVAQASFAL